MTRNEKYILYGTMTTAIILLLSNSADAAPGGDAATVSYLDKDGYPSGMRRNNPGNIVRGAGYKGEVFLDKGRFAQFETWAWGIRAMIVLLRKYMTTGSSYPNPCVTTPQNTIELIVKQYAPPKSCGGDNDDATVEKYIRYVSERTGYARSRVLRANKTTLRRIVRAMAYFEQGRECVTDAQFNFAYNLI